MLRSSIVVTGITLLGSALGFVVQLFLAHHFGAGTDVDVYLFAQSWPTFFAGMVSAFLSYVAIPQLVAREVNPAGQRDYFVTSVVTIAIFAVVVTMIGLGLGELQTASLPADSPIRTHAQRARLVSIGWLICAVQIGQAYALSALHAKRHHITSASLGLLPYIGMIASTVLLADRIGVSSVAIGMLAGTIASTVAAAWFLRGRFASDTPRRWVWAETRALFVAAPYAVLALSCFSIYSVVDAFWAPRAGEGTLASLGYAQRLVIAIGNLAVAGPSAILVPRISELARQADPDTLRRFLRKTLVTVGLGAVIFALPLALAPQLLIHLLFARGNFSGNNVADVAATLAHMTPGMVCMLLSVISLRAMFCLPGAEKAAAMLGGAWGFLYFAASAAMVGYGAPGLASAYSVTWVTVCICIVTALFRKAGGKAHGRAPAGC
ncbi:hypothetical protein PI87_10230 [Ralstonia sp. A12]|uniref:lipid II flippase MurJ n=1 Tax=Ralstonia sp. A12 TaxID=1217052 RepID=UPI000574F9D3|nr:lipid II flippase MurJ [Ralstonia sp. A12]KHK56107.1 hypothetical protein PI87_10230 [Ralstonia sp. A12]